jgi:hypothetical protein
LAVGEFYFHGIDFKGVRAEDNPKVEGRKGLRDFGT